jgi:hypothetical protein
MASENKTQKAPTVPAVKVPEPQPEDKIKQLARWIVANRVLSWFDAPANMIKTVFLPIGLGAFSEWAKDDLKTVVAFGVLGVDASLGYSINGMPIFAQIRVWRTEDFVRACTLAAQVFKAQDEILGPDPDAPVETGETDG